MLTTNATISTVSGRMPSTNMPLRPNEDLELFPLRFKVICMAQPREFQASSLTVTPPSLA
jgi:hypothetical protein